MRALLPLIVALLFVLNAQVIQAQTWTWTDDKGYVRFADDYSQIPEKYRKQAVQGPSKKSAEAFEEWRQSPNRIERSHATVIPKFRVVAQNGPDLALLVPQNTTTEQLKALIFEFRAARKGNTLSKMIPPTTPGQRVWIKEKRSYISSDYLSVWIFVFSEPDWATLDRFNRFLDSNIYSAADQQFNKEYLKHIRAQYYWSLTSNSEDSGNLGFDDDLVGVCSGDHVRSPDYQKLF